MLFPKAGAMTEKAHFFSPTRFLKGNVPRPMVFVSVIPENYSVFRNHKLSF